MFSCPLIRFSGRLYPKLIKHEKTIFLVFIVLSLLQLWLTKYVPSLDGPQHLYTANMLKQLALGNELFQTVFKLNDVIAGYWTGHALLTFFMFIFPPWLAEKFFLSAYVLGMIFAFRYLVRILNPSSGNFVAFLIFPFIYHSFILYGYYAFSIGIIFYFLAFGYWIRNHASFKWKHVVVFALILLGLYLSHAFVYVLFGFSFVVYFISTFIYAIFKSGWKLAFQKFIFFGLKATAAAAPSLLLLVIYFRSVMNVSSTVAGTDADFEQLLNYLLRIRQLVGFHHEWESIGYIPLFVLIALLSLGVLVLFLSMPKDKSRRISDLMNPKNAFLFVAIGMLLLYFFAPDKISAGSLTNRFGLFFFLAIITWLAMQKFPKTLQILSLIIIFLSVSYTRYLHQRFLRNLNRDAAEIIELADYMQPNSVVYYLQSSKNWVHLHFQLYATAAKPIVNIRTTQNEGQFVTVWNYDHLPRFYTGERMVIPAGSEKLQADVPGRQIDYITVFRYDKFMQDSTNADWHKILASDYKLVHVSARGMAALFSVCP